MRRHETLKRLAPIVLFTCGAALLALLAWGALRMLGGRGSGATALETVLARERAAAHFEHGDLALARAELAPLVARSEPALEDLERAAAVELLDRSAGADPRPLFERIRARAPDDPALH